MASRQNKNRFLAAIATRWKAREAFPPACARPAAWNSLSRATSASWKKSSGWRPTCRLRPLCAAQTRIAPIPLVGSRPAPRGRTHLSARLQLEIRVGAVTFAAKRSRRTSRLSPGRGSLTRIRRSSNCWSTRCPSAASSKSRTSIPTPSITASISFIGNASYLPHTASAGSPIFPFAGCTLASTGKITW